MALNTTFEGASEVPLPGAFALFTNRLGGVSAAPYDSFNLGHHVGDEVAAVTENRRRLTAVVGQPICFVNQVHSAVVHVVDEEWNSADNPGAKISADALVTKRDDLALAIMVADCMPILFSAPTTGVIAATHSGRPGFLKGIIPATLKQMEALGAEMSDIHVAIGPSVCGACYEVPKEMQGEAAAIVSASAVTTRWGTTGIDLRAGAVAQLAAHGVPETHIQVDFPCTSEDENYFSYRREQQTGRFVGVIRRA